MAIIKISVCDFCGDRQDVDDRKIYWASRHAQIVATIPPDGINGGGIGGIACQQCRRELFNGLKEIVDGIKFRSQFRRDG